MKSNSRNNDRLLRAKRIKTKVFGSSVRPRLSVFRSLKVFSAQVIDDSEGKTMLHVSTSGSNKLNNLNGVKELGDILASKCHEKDIKEVVFDRSGYRYHGKVKVFAEALRLGGLKF